MTPLSQPLVAASAVGGNPCSAEHLPGLSAWSCSRRARVKGQGAGPQGEPVWCRWRQPCLADRVRDGEVLLTKALIFLSLLYAFY